MGPSEPRTRPKRAFELAMVVPAVCLLWLLRGADLIADVPMWALVAAVLVSYAASLTADALWPPGCPTRQLHCRLAVQMLGVTVAVYVTGWGPALGVGYLSVATMAVRSSGARAARPALVWALAGICAGQLTVALDVAPVITEPRLLHGLAVLMALGLASAIWTVGVTAHEKETSTATAAALLGLARVLAEPTDQDEVAERLAAAVPRVTGADRSTVLVWDRAERTMGVRAAYGYDEEAAARVRSLVVRPGDTPALERMLGSPKPVHVTAATTDDPFVRAALSEAGARETVVMPIVKQGELIGAITMARSEHGPPLSLRPAMLERLAGVADQAAVALEKARLLEQERQTFERLLDAERVKSDLLAVVSHELRTPLAVMMGAARTLQWRGADLHEPVREELVDSIVRRGEQLDRLVEDLLQSSGDVRLDPAPVDVASLVRSAVADAAKLAPECDIRADVDGELIVVGDGGRLRQVLDNLIGNAVKYGAGAHILVGAGLHERTVRLRVDDDGPGMTDEEREKAFEPFWQADSSARRRAGGIGLGLHISRRIVESHGGTIDIAGGPGQGTHVVVCLPVAGPGS